MPANATATRPRRRRRATARKAWRSSSARTGRDRRLAGVVDASRPYRDRGDRIGEPDRGATGGVVSAPTGRVVVASDRGDPLRGARPGAVRAVRVGQPAQSADPAAGGSGRAELAAHPARRELAAAVAGPPPPARRDRGAAGRGERGEGSPGPAPPGGPRPGHPAATPEPRVAGVG